MYSKYLIISHGHQETVDCSLFHIILSSFSMSLVMQTCITIILICCSLRIMESTTSEFENLDTPDSFFSVPDKLTNIVSRAIINIKNSESNHPPRAKKNYKNPCSLCHKQVIENQKGIQCNNCENWVHAKCSGTTNKEYQQLRLEADDHDV